MSDYLQYRRDLKTGVKSKPEKEPTKPIAKVADKRKEVNKEYHKIVKEMLKENPWCEIKETGCEKISTGLHHQKKRTPDTILDKRFLIRSCNNCNLWCELHPLEAIEKEYSISKFAPVVIAHHDTELNTTIIEPVK